MTVLHYHHSRRRLPRLVPTSSVATAPTAGPPTPSVSAPAPLLAPVPTPSSGYESELEVRQVSLRSAARVATAFGFVSALVWLGALTVCWAAGATLGITGRFEHFVQDIGVEGFHIASAPVVGALAILGVAWILAVVVLAVLAAASYNLVADWLGGLHVVVGPLRDRDDATIA